MASLWCLVYIMLLKLLIIKDQKLNKKKIVDDHATKYDFKMYNSKILTLSFDP